MLLRKKRRTDVRKCAWVAAVIAAACMFGFGMGTTTGAPHAAAPASSAPAVTTSD